MPGQYTDTGLGAFPLLEIKNSAYIDIARLYNAVQILAQQIDKVLTLSDDVRVDNGAGGLILKDNQATPHYWRVKISNVGVLTTTDIGTTLP